MTPRRRPTSTELSHAVVDSAVLAIASLVTFWLTTSLLARIYSVSPEDDLLGGMWAVIATIFVCRHSVQQSTGAALSRVAATSVSFVLCLAYLLLLPFHMCALALLIGLSALTTTLIGRPGDAVTAAITTAVVLVVVAVSPQHAWQQPILRFADTVIGVAVGVAAAWLTGQVLRPRIQGGP
jgi:uncharacterized membrane protein YccC